MDGRNEAPPHGIELAPLAPPANLTAELVRRLP